MPDLPTTPHHENALQHLPDHPTGPPRLGNPISTPTPPKGNGTDAGLPPKLCGPAGQTSSLTNSDDPPTKIHRISSHTNQGEPHSRGGNTQDMLMPSQSTTTP